ncbi:MAG: DUF2236 domain-containing protein [Rhodococcus sp.]|nr:DUF2236 domain-containing protein [Rhodococcus sp. (in: high G+C Gram-positive bacteria)]
MNLLTAPTASGHGRHANRRRIEHLDPVADCYEIHRLTAGFEFPWDYRRSLEFALFRTYCVPTISALLQKTGEFEYRPQKRYDDTSLLMAEMLEHGYDSPRGRESLRTVNRMHGKYDIDNDDMLYVLSTFIYEPIDWIDKYGWRRLHPNERLAAFHFYSEVGKRMGIKHIPESYQQFHAFKSEYERSKFHYTDDNNKVGTYTLNLFTSWYPSWTRPVAERVVYALMDERMATAFGFPTGSPRLRSALDTAMYARARVERFMPARKNSKASKDPNNRTYPGYPEGYSPSDLGTEKG